MSIVIFRHGDDELARFSERVSSFPGVPREGEAVTLNKLHWTVANVLWDVSTGWMGDVSAQVQLVPAAQAADKRPDLGHSTVFAPTGSGKSKMRLSDGATAVSVQEFPYRFDAVACDSEPAFTREDGENIVITLWIGILLTGAGSLFGADERTAAPSYFFYAVGAIAFLIAALRCLKPLFRKKRSARTITLPLRALAPGRAGEGCSREDGK